jgi:hypothetical protein
MVLARSRAQTFRQRPAADHSPSGHCCVPAGIREDAWACSQHHPQGLAGGAVPGAREFSTAAGPGEDSFESESEHEGPQKLIRKVSTSGQMGTKVRLGRGPMRGLWAEGMLWEVPSIGIRRRGAGARPGWGVASHRGLESALEIPELGLRDI